MTANENADPLFIDTNALVALFDEDDHHHQSATAVFDGIQRGDLRYGPLFTSRYVLSETATTMVVGIDHRAAVEALATVSESPSINVLEVDTALFDRTVSQFERYDDHEISFVDHTNAVLADEYDIEHIFAFDSDFATLGLQRVPVDV
ncbi:type II toxin-antitoxin system VapC family toxin [Halovivax limisalsi]|uniref:type II toxin-antitoxin system VapC family toxin n=1 Tax=Halovivax limisalsi TaxID=1453760 RepID=UPI001FFD0154|nr:PIN domain-containing protein [Halovivax limisalsi]